MRSICGLTDILRVIVKIVLHHPNLIFQIILLKAEIK